MIVLKDVNKTIGQKHIIKDLSLHIRFGDVIASVGHGTLGIALFLFSAGKVGIEWNLTTIIYYIGTIIGGILIQGGMFIIFRHNIYFGNQIWLCILKFICIWRL